MLLQDIRTLLSGRVFSRKLVLLAILLQVKAVINSFTESVHMFQVLTAHKYDVGRKKLDLVTKTSESERP